MKRRLKNATVVVLAIASTLVFAWFTLGWMIGRKGDTMWAEAQGRLAAAGETLDIQELRLPPVPDDENFGATPTLKNLTTFSDNPAEIEAAENKRERIESLVDWYGSPHLYEYRSASFFQSTYATLPEYLALLEGEVPGKFEGMSNQDSGRRILEILDSSDVATILAELSSVSSREFHQFLPGVWEEEFTEEVTDHIVQAVNPSGTLRKMLSLYASAAAHSGDPEKFHRAVNVLLSLLKLTGNEPTYLAFLESRDATAILTSLAWEALSLGVLLRDDLAWLQGMLEELKIVEQFLFSSRTELCYAVTNLDAIRRNRARAGAYYGKKGVSVIEHFPDGVFHFYQAAITNAYLDHVITPTKSGTLTLNLASVSLRKFIDDSREKAFTPMIMVAKNMAILPNMIDSTLLLDGSIKMAIAACALERYFLDEKRYPKTLGDLVPEYLPSVPEDPITGGPIGYRTDESNGRYRLWCTGFDAADDGGEIIPEPEPGESVPKFNDRDYEGDWVWRYPSL